MHWNSYITMHARASFVLFVRVWTLRWFQLFPCFSAMDVHLVDGAQQQCARLPPC